MSCAGCSKAENCSGVKKFIHTHELKINETSMMLKASLNELFGNIIVDKAFILLDRLRHQKGYLYAVVAQSETIYLRKDEIPTNKTALFAYNPANNYYEMRLQNGK